MSLELETDVEISIPFERKLTFQQSEEVTYASQPKLADEDISHSNHLIKLFAHSNIDKEVLRKRIKAVLRNKSQTTIFEVIEQNGGIEKGLPELFGYLGIIKEFKYSISSEKTQKITFNVEQNKSIHIPEIILTK